MKVAPQLVYAQITLWKQRKGNLVIYAQSRNGGHACGTSLRVRDSRRPRWAGT